MQKLYAYVDDAGQEEYAPCFLVSKFEETKNPDVMLGLSVSCGFSGSDTLFIPI